MKVTFVASGASAGTAPRLIARVVEQDRLPSGLDAVAAEGARVSRFSGKLGQVFDYFAGGTGGVRREVLAGIGEPGAAARTQAYERAGKLALVRDMGNEPRPLRAIGREIDLHAYSSRFQGQRGDCD